MFRIMTHYLKAYKWQVLALMVFQIAQALLALYLPNLNADIINKGVASGSSSEIYRYGAIMLGFSLLQVAAAIVATYFSSRLAMRLGYEVRRDYFKAVEGFSLQEVERFSAGSLITRATNDVLQVQMMFYQGFAVILQAPIMFLGGIILAIKQDATLTWLLVVIIPVIFIVAMLLMGRMRPLFGQLQDRLDNLNRIVREQITGVRVIRAFTREATEAERFEKGNSQLRQTMVGVGRLMSLMMAAMMSVMIPRAMVSAKRINEVCDTTSSITAPEHPYHPTDPKGVVEFRHVSFRYPGAEEPVLDDVNFTLEPGKTLAIIGSTGSGKSTIIRLAQRMFDATEGQILVDGHDVREYDPHELAALFGTVPQKALLFTGTVASNLKFGDRNADEAKMWKALEIAQSDGFIRENPEGLDAPVAQGGTNFSGGQRQRLCIARAIMRDPKIFTFDDSFSALDFATDRALRDALKPITRQTAVIIVAQRISTVMDADQIMVMENGRIVGMGRHEELMRDCETYRQIADSQLKNEEVD